MYVRCHTMYPIYDRFKTSFTLANDFRRGDLLTCVLQLKMAVLAVKTTVF